jgi:Flp pilus assembly protein TadG
MLKRSVQKLKQFSACTSGNLTMFLAISAIPVMMAAGVAIDYGRYSNVRQDVAMALDAGVMTAASSLVDDETITAADLETAKQNGIKSFKNNLGTQYGSSIPDPVFTVNATNDGFVATVEGNVDSKFLSFAGMGKLPVKLKAEGVYGVTQIIGSDLEVAMMLDVSGSMCNGVGNGCSGNTVSQGWKMYAMKTAAKDFINTVVWPDQTKFTSRISVVPFANLVKIEKDGQAGAKFQAATGLAPTWSGWGSQWSQRTDITTKSACQALDFDWWDKDNLTCWQAQAHWKQGWKARPCLTDRYVISPVSPRTNKWDTGEQPAAADGFSLGLMGNRSPVSDDSTTNALWRDGTTAAKYVYTDNDKANSQFNYNPNGTCEGFSDANIIVPLTNDKSKLLSALGGLTGSSGTAGFLGTSWAWYTISPEWASFWGGNSQPEPYSKIAEKNEDGKNKLYKFALLMTDGAYNNTLNVQDSSKATTLNANTVAMCTAMKAKGIEVYTVGFDMASEPVGKQMLKDCSDNPATHFFDASDEAALKAAFKKIGDKIREQAGQQARISK